MFKTMNNKTCLILHLCNPFHCVIRCWFNSIPISQFSMHFPMCNLTHCLFLCKISLPVQVRIDRFYCKHLREWCITKSNIAILFGNKILNHAYDAGTCSVYSSRWMHKRVIQNNSLSHWISYITCCCTYGHMLFWLFERSRIYELVSVHLIPAAILQ